MWRMTLIWNDPPASLVLRAGATGIGFEDFSHSLPTNLHLKLNLRPEIFFRKLLDGYIRSFGEEIHSEVINCPIYRWSPARLSWSWTDAQVITQLLSLPSFRKGPRGFPVLAQVTQMFLSFSFSAAAIISSEIKEGKVGTSQLLVPLPAKRRF